MKRIFLIPALALTVLFTAPLAWAETTFITDKISVELFSSTFQRGMLVTTVKSGAIVEVLESDGDYTKVRTQDGQEGWLHNKYLSTEKPTQVSYLQLMAKHQQLQEEVDKLRNQTPNSAEAEKEKAILGKMRGDLAQAKKTIASLEGQLKEKAAALKQNQQKLASLEKQHQEALTTQQKAEAEAAKQDDQQQAQATATEPPAVEAPIMQSSSMPINPPFNLDYPIAIKWLLAVMLLSIFAGSYLGYSWLDNKIARRHGGVRIR
jgi:SH3 domain protein